MTTACRSPDRQPQPKKKTRTDSTLVYNDHPMTVRFLVFARPNSEKSYIGNYACQWLGVVGRMTIGGMETMQTKVLALLATLALVSIAPLAAADEHWDQDRELTYAGTTRYDHGLNQVCADAAGGECPAVIPSGIISAVCDDDEDGIDGTGIHGIGGGIFCGIRMGATITVTLNDEALEVPEAAVTCPSHNDTVNDPITGMPLYGVTWHQGIGDAAPSLTIQVPEDCMETVEDHDDLTNIGNFFNVGSATAGTITLEYV